MINHTFLDENPCDWVTNKQYEYGMVLVKKSTVVNDVVKRGIKLISEFNERFTGDEEQKQFIIQLPDEYRKRFPDVLCYDRWK